MPGCSEESETIYKNFLDSEDYEMADELVHYMDAARRKTWKETTSNTDFKNTSRKAWSLLKKLCASQHVIQQ